ncbi:hypothetical protein H5410_048849 [Solanum commersonii]|uniref:Uncharacterized protein n=1 Tax=Solanum commersonii TaxID=4109 RepID=A0A9J5XLQ5_SOLCO|nr:hypothetical protein H5410_048849 [Solanum commersonii]
MTQGNILCQNNDVVKWVTTGRHVQIILRQNNDKSCFVLIMTILYTDFIENIKQDVIEVVTKYNDHYFTLAQSFLQEYEVKKINHLVSDWKKTVDIIYHQILKTVSNTKISSKSKKKLVILKSLSFNQLSQIRSSWSWCRIIAGIRSMFFCYARSTKFTSNISSYFTLSDRAIIVLCFFIMSDDCVIPLTMVLCIDINGTHIKNFITDVFSK